MTREYHKWFSPLLQRDMELLAFGHAGNPVLFFPTRTARFYDYEDWKVIEALQPKIEAGSIQVYCLDSIDKESFYANHIPPAARIHRHLLYEQYVLHEVMDLVRRRNPGPDLIAAGCSLGAYHAVNLAFKYPWMFKKVVGLSGRYDLTLKMEHFEDLFEGYMDETVYFNMPARFIPNLHDEQLITQLKKMEIIFVVGQQDAFLDNNRYLSDSLWRQGVWNALHIWDGESHKARYWRYMVQLYL
ncbi:esterase family protein [Dinghuibacter silviterrae]|uniref:Esterase/lipase superfamily enzyme n=1 Tax=Dinghuibacter silviterrae TaxID=1539049 RepID=A0A4R8DT96_9BACT|nr:alpha/beta hydrolase-fold protein [Dinghuibacter silviterrae]TDX01504.1 esterase/lipase superfamily enzyme [Dinghuibacter silviterrae]